MRVGKERSPGSEAIDVWSVDSALVTAEAIHPVLHVIDGEEEDVGSRRRLSEERRAKGKERACREGCLEWDAMFQGAM